MPEEPAPVSWQAFHVPKRGHTAEEYEDACAADSQTRRFAVADGAAESSYASVWANLLVKGYVTKAPGRTGSRDWLEGAQRLWAAAVDGLSLPWYADVKRAEGAFATFLGLRLLGRLRRGTWHALAVGDSGLFQLRADKVISAFPMTRVKDFSNRPCLIGSRMGMASVRRQRQQHRGRWQAGDRFLLMTDALAQWFLRGRARGQRPWLKLVELAGHKSSQDSFVAWIEELRDRERLRNDDVTVLVVQL